MKKSLALIGSMLLSMVLFAGVASAHVTVYPKESTQGASEKFTLRVPTEKDSPTVKVEVKLATDDVSVSRVEPKPGWKYDLAKDATGKITGITWTATGDGLTATEFGEFNMTGKVGDKAGKISWKAYQTYKDGSIVEWVGAEGSDKPASVTTVKAKPAGASTDSHGNTVAAAPAAAAPAASAPGASQTPLYLSIAAVVLGALSLIVSLTKKAK